MSNVIKAIGELNRMCGQLRVAAEASDILDDVDVCMLRRDGIRGMAEVIEWCADILLKKLLDEDE